jgi:hypothetical protein
MVLHVTRKPAFLASTPLVARPARKDLREPVTATAAGRVRGEVRLEVVGQTTQTMQRDANQVLGSSTWSPPV